MRHRSGLLFAVSCLSAACFVDLTGGGGSGSATDTTSVFMTGGFGQGGAGTPGAGGSGGNGGNGGSGGSTVTGVGGGACGDGVPGAGEECDDGNQVEDDGCTSDCQADMLGACPDVSASFAFLAAVGDVIEVSGDTNGGTDNLRLGDEGSCKSDGADEWLAVTVLAPGTIEAHLVATTGFGGNQEKAVLHVRRGCEDQLYVPELACSDTNGMTQGIADFRFFARTGDVLYFAVDGDGGNDKGTYELTVTMTSVCGDGTPMGLEQCDDQTLGCNGCMHTDVTCGGALGAGFYDAMSGHCYVVAELAPQSFFAARQACFLAGGDLLTIDAMDGTLPGSIGEVWVGLADLVKGDCIDEFRWLANGMLGTLSFLDDEDPNKIRCATRNGLTQLDDRLCGAAHGFYCELTLDNP